MKATPAELEILNVLWDQGPATVRQVHQQLEAARPTGYTTVLKQMQIMAEKGLVVRDERNRAHVYKSVPMRQETQRQVLADIMDRLFAGSSAQLVLQALEQKPASKEELKEIRQMIRRHEENAK